MKQLCQRGFDCPYHRIAEGDDICIYPYIRITENEESDTFGFPDEGDCPLLDWKSDLYKILTVFEESEEARKYLESEYARIESDNNEKLKKMIDEVLGD